MAPTEQKSLKELFDSMEYGPANEDRKIMDKWLAEHDHKFGQFINNNWLHPEGSKYKDSLEPCSGAVLATTIDGTDADVSTAVDAAEAAYGSWSQLSGHVRAKHLYAFARHVQKHARLLAVLEACDNGKTIRETRDCDVPLVARHLYYHAGWAQLMDTEMAGWKSVGVVAAIVPWNFPLMLLAWKVCPALAAGNTVVLKPATNTRLSALLLAEVAAEAGLPAGVFNVVTGGGSLGSTLALHPKVDKVAFTGSTEVGQLLRRITAGTGKKLSLELGGKSPVVVFDSADLDAAVEGVVDAIWFNQGQVCSAGSRLLVQESIYEKFISKVKLRMKTLRLGKSLDKCADMSAVVSEQQKASIAKCVEQAKEEGAEVYQVDAPEGCYYPPTLITNVSPAHECVMEEIFGPVVTAMSFRTAKEAIALANNSRYGLGASVWSEKIGLALEVAKQIKAGAVWINAHNLFDAAAGFGGYRHSGYGRDGGKEGLMEYVRPKWQARGTVAPPDAADIKPPAFDADGPHTPGAVAEGGAPAVDRTYKLFYGGAQKRPDGGYCSVAVDAEGRPFALVPEANRKDVRNAVEAAVKAQPGWEKRSGFNRSQILFYLAENLQQRAAEWADHLRRCTGHDGTEEVSAAIERLFHWAAYCDKHGGAVQETTLYGTVLRLHEAVGVVGVACPSAAPLLAFVTLLGAALSRGSAVVAVPSPSHPTLALALQQLLECSDVPAGVVNILTGHRDHLSACLASHHAVQAVWYFGTHPGAAMVEHLSAASLKRTWAEAEGGRDWAGRGGEGQELLYHATQVKNVWLPMGDIFAN